MNRPQPKSFSRRMLRQLDVYLRLTRLDRPIGIWLLAWPMLWALWIAGTGRPDATILVVFALGAVITRSAGCVINDVADRHFDGNVTRTQDRPLATGEIGVVAALALFIGLGFIAIGLAAMAFAAQTNAIPQDAWFLFAITALWAVIYDTMYAMCDREDDLAAGIRSSAILFGESDKFVIGALQAMMLMALLLLGQRLGMTAWYYLAIVSVAMFMAYQQWLIRNRQPAACLAAFKNNHYIGLTVFVGIALHYLYLPPAA